MPDKIDELSDNIIVTMTEINTRIRDRTTGLDKYLEDVPKLATAYEALSNSLLTLERLKKERQSNK